MSRDDTIAKYLHDVPDDKRDITLSQLLSHTSGLLWDAVPRGKNLSRDDVLARILNAKLRSQPGEKFAYSNAGYELLGIVAETVTDRSYAELLREYVFKPSKMRDSGVVSDTEKDGNAAVGYNEWTSLGTWSAWNDGWRHGSGDVVASLRDTYAWHKSLRDGRILAPQTFRDMIATHASADGENYGYGWFTSRTESGDSLVAHGGDNKGYHTELRWYVERNLVIIVLSNLELYDESGSGLGLHKRIIANSLSRIAKGETVAMPPASLPTKASELARYVGEYRVDGGRVAITWNGERLMAGIDGQTAINHALTLDDPQLSAKGRTSETLLRAVAARDTALVRETLGDDAGFFLSYAFKERDEFEQEFGGLANAVILGTKPLPWDPALRRTVARLEFHRKTMDYQFTWNDDSYYESISDTGVPHAVVIPLAPVAIDEFIAWDIVARRGSRFRFSSADGTMRLLAIEPIQSQR